MSCFSDNNLKMKVLTFVKVKIRLMQKSIFAKVEMVAKVVRGGPLNGTILSLILILICKKWQKPGPFFGKALKNFAKSQGQNRKIGVSLLIPSNSY